MTEMPNAGLYGGADQAPTPKPPSLMDQLVGVFTEPSALFGKLRQAPSWVPAVLLGLVFAVAVSLVWGLKVDVDAMLRPVLERNPRISADQIDTIIQMQGKLMLPFGILGALVMPWLVTLLVAFLLWLVGRGFQEDGAPSYLQALSATAVAGLVMVPHSLLTLVMALAKPVGGLTPEKLPPTSLGFFLSPETPRMQALLYRIDLFVIGYYLLLFLGCRRLLRLSAAGSAVAAAVVALVTLGLPVLFAR